MNTYIIRDICLCRVYVKAGVPASILYGPIRMLAGHIHRLSVGAVMKQNSNHRNSLNTLASILRDTKGCNESVLNQVINSACNRFQSVRARTGFNEQIKAGAWVDAIMTLISAEMPAWRLRRIVQDDGLWVCSLSCHPDLPIELDDIAEAFHHDLPLAMLSAFVEARLATSPQAAPVTTPMLRPQEHYAVCCENFA